MIRNRHGRRLGIASLLLLVSCAGREGTGDGPPQTEATEQRGVECTSLLGSPLYAGEVDAPAIAAVNAKLTDNPDDLNLIFEKGLLLENARRFTAAIALYSARLAEDPTNVTLLRRRGHRYINIREHAAAIADLEQAVSLHTFKKVKALGYKENLHWAIWYYLGLAQALHGDLEAALVSFRESHAYSADKVALLASTNWIHNLLRRLGRPQEARKVIAPINEGMGYSGNYFKNILVYKGLKKESDVFDEGTAKGFVLGTMGYGMANWRRASGDLEGAERLLRKVASSDAWHSNGVMAAEAELARRK